jgi:hypothetical protein
MNDHRQTADIQQWFAWKSGRGHAGGYQHEGAGLGHRSGESGKLAQLLKICGIYTGCQNAGKPLSRSAASARPVRGISVVVQPAVRPTFERGALPQMDSLNDQ